MEQLFYIKTEKEEAFTNLYNSKKSLSVFLMYWSINICGQLIKIFIQHQHNLVFNKRRLAQQKYDVNKDIETENGMT